MSFVDELILDDHAFVEIPGLRGLRVARLTAAADGSGRTLEVIEGAKGVIIPAMTHPSAEHGKVVSGSLRFMREGVVRTLSPGDTWEVAAGAHQGPHVILEDGTRVAVLRDGKSAFDVV
jgi:quercetin dioxygenase-like cupin family protein